MLTKRILVLIFLIPICVGFAALGGWYFAVFIAGLLAVAGWEWANAFSLGNYRPSRWILTPGIILLVLSRQVPVPHLTEAVLAACILAAMTVHLLQYEQGRDLAATDLMVTLGGLLYLGWLGGHFILLRALPDGMVWILMALTAVWFADVGAYFIGSKWGKHKLSRRASPNKSWEGYAGGILSAVLITSLATFLGQLISPRVTLLHRAVLGLVISVFSPLGDLAESMIKRQFNLKDSSNLLPGHGGILDRIDSWLWAIPLAYYLLLLWL